MRALLRLLLLTSSLIPQISGAEGFARADPHAAVRARVSRAVAGILGPAKPWADASRLARLDDDVVGWVRSELENVPAAKRENVLRALERSRTDHVLVGPDGELSDALLGDDDGDVTTDALGVTLRIDGFAAGGEMGRAALVHEIGHVVRYTPAAPPETTQAYADALNARPLAIYREELYAFRATYRYLRRVYDLGDVARLRAEEDRLLVLRKNLEVRGLLKWNRWRKVTELTDRLDAANIEDVAEYMALEGDVNSADDLEQALTMSESEYVKLRTKDYAVDQYYETTGLGHAAWWVYRHWISLKIGAGIATAATCAAWLLY